MPRQVNINPKYRKHRATGQAVVTLDGRDFYLGPHGTKVSRNEYDRVLGEWLTNGRRLPSWAADAPSDLTVIEVLAAYWPHVDRYYRKPDGSPTTSVECIKQAIRPLKRLYGRTLAADFGPLKLRALRDEMIRLGWSRSTVNRQTNRVRAVFKWAAGREMIPPSIHHGLLAVEGLRAGRSDARETPPVRPVDDERVRATLPHLSPTVRAMVEVQLLTAMRPGEVCLLRPSDIDHTGPTWTYRPADHKTAHHGHDRVISIGPKAQALLRPLLPDDPAAYIFSPARAVAERHARDQTLRRTPLSCGNRPGTNRRTRPKRTPGDRYDVAAYRRAIARACDAAFPVPTAPGSVRSAADEETRIADWRREHRWHPHQLRHTRATALRKSFGLDGASVVLGHKSLAVTQGYAQADAEEAGRIMGQVG